MYKGLIKFDTERKIRKRYYRIDEIFRAYKKHLIAYHKGYSEIRSKELNLERFVEHIKGYKKSLYTVDKAFIEKWVDYLFNHEMNYSAHYQMKMIQKIKYFFDWFYNERYRKNNPMHNFPTTLYYKKIRKLCKPKSKVKKYEDLVPPLKKIFEGITSYEAFMRYNPKTIQHHKSGWYCFLKYLEDINILDITKVDEIILEKYLRYLTVHKNTKGTLITLNTQSRHIIALKRLFYYLTRFRYIERDPALLIELPKNPKGLPTAGMNLREITLILEQPDTNTWLGIRDKAILETLYSSGVRNQELRFIKLKDIQKEDGLIRVNTPKGGIGYQRIIPIGSQALYWINRYIKEVRSKYVEKKKDHEYIFVNYKGQQMSGSSVLKIVKTYLTKAGLRNDKIVTHSFRVSCATGMLKGKGNSLKGADIKWVQEQLGHTSIQSTARYLRLVPGELKRIHQKHHPRERKHKNKDKKTTEKK